MSYFADLHVHSKHSRATSADCDLEHLAAWGLQKGITVIGTGDFTHPAWRAELRDKLVEAEPGLYRLREDLEGAVRARLGARFEAPVRFMLSVEISGIYKRHDRTRKVHNLVYAASFATVDRIVERLERVGNLGSDGRPILGLDSRDLLEIVLEAGDDAYIVPAHIWTPWFAMFGSRSGFDTVEECFGDLTRHIFAVETGLSSDPAMNWRLSQLDRYRLVSNSDAHSPAKLGREATRFEGALDYFALRRALETGEGFGGTVEFFPEEGKYHADGHRKCGVRLSPRETRAREGRCPACQSPLTVGVMSRVDALADRPEGEGPGSRAPFRSFVPLPEIIAETVEAGPDSKRVARVYERLIAGVGPELFILDRAPLEDLRRHGSALVAEGIARMRAGEVIREAGYDGEYGVVRMFRPGELARAHGVALLFAEEPASAAPLAALQPGPARARGEEVATPDAEPASAAPEPEDAAPPAGMLAGLDPEQARAAGIAAGPLLIVAGPGTGKTRTLTRRIAHLVRERGVDPGTCLAITFTRRAAGELQERLVELLGAEGERVVVRTFHGLGRDLLRAHAAAVGLTPGFRVAHEWEQEAILQEGLQLAASEARRVLAAISHATRTGARPEPGSELEQALRAYRRGLRARDRVDCDELVSLAVELLAGDAAARAAVRARFPHVSVDEYQDVDERQYALVRLLVPPDGDLCAIGDPDQAIYGFRGADVGFFLRFREDFPATREVQLVRNYRSGRRIVDASMQVIEKRSLAAGRVLRAQRDDALAVVIHEAASAAAEAEFVVHTIERLIGGYSFFSVDSGRVRGGDASEYGFGDFAVLYRSSGLLPPLEEALLRSGIPFERRSHKRLDDLPEVRAIVDALAGQPEAPPEARLAELAARAPELARGAALLRPLARRCRSLAELSDEVAAGAQCDAWDPRAARVSLLTMHAAKGLEFPVVFLIGCEDGIVPLSFGPDSDLDEERRLFFVGMTRAEQRLYLTRARTRVWRGEPREQAPSPFILDIRDELTERSRDERRRPARAKAPQLPLF